MGKKKIFLTGAAGNMGRAGLAQLLEHADEYEVTAFELPSASTASLEATYRGNPGLRIIRGNLIDSQSLLKPIKEADIVLHVAAFNSPAADKNPELAWKVNYQGTKNVVDAIHQSGRADEIKLVHIGTVGEMGNRPVPYHWGRVGDPILPSVFDNYAVSKIAGERYVIESGLKNWVSLRQTGIMHNNIFGVDDGIIYHQPLDNRLEWITAHDAGNILLKVCSDKIPEDFWGNVYNIGGGEKCRLTAYEFLDKFYKMVGANVMDLEEPNRFAIRNFHGVWYYDSDKLESILHFRSQNIDDVLEEIKSKLPFELKLIRYLPKKLIKNTIMRLRAFRSNAPLYWIQHNMLDKVNAFFGSVENWKKIGGWDQFDFTHNPGSTILNHGYDENKDPKTLCLEDLVKAAAFRGGACLADGIQNGDWTSKVSWTCSEGHVFQASPFLILKAGHWCSQCVKAHWQSPSTILKSPFLYQLFKNQMAS